jgi:hypothetical protein
VNVSRSQPAQRSRSGIQARRAIESSSEGTGSGGDRDALEPAVDKRAMMRDEATRGDFVHRSRGGRRLARQGRTRSRDRAQVLVADLEHGSHDRSLPPSRDRWKAATSRLQGSCARGDRLSRRAVAPSIPNARSRSWQSDRAPARCGDDRGVAHSGSTCEAVEVTKALPAVARFRAMKMLFEVAVRGRA